MIRTKIKCGLCGQEISKSNYKKHLSRHENNLDSFIPRYVSDHKGNVCKFCGKDLPSERGRISHESCCKQNPQRKLTAFEVYGSEAWSKKVSHTAWNKGLTKNTDDRIRRYSEVIASRYASGELQGVFTGRKHSEETKQKLREIAIANQLGGHPYRSSITYKGISLDSSLELEMAKKLDSLGIKWSRCHKFPYVDLTGKKHNYTPDFYLPEYDLYLDPKNDYLIENINPALGYKDVDKIKWVCEQNNVNIVVISEEEIYNFDIERYMRSSSNG